MTARHHLLQAAERARGQRTGDVSHDVVLFARLLRRIDVAVAPTASLTAVRALRCVRLEQRSDVRAALAISMTTSIADRALFDVVFDTFWSDEDTDLADIGGSSGAGESDRGAGVEPSESSMGLSRSPGRRQPHEGVLARRAVHSREPGRSGAVAVAGGSEIDALARRLARAFGTSPGRRFVTGEHGDAIDVRASMRANLRFGEELFVLRRTIRRRDRSRLVVLCDISSSMQPYTSLFLAFVHALTRLVRGVEAAVFNVEMLMVTDVFRRNDRRRALAWLGRQQSALAGGTRIGHCLIRFLDAIEASNALRVDTIALILSDGWDVGEPDLLETGLRRLRQLAKTVVWCDPHAAATGYDPQVQGMSLARPYCDHYLDFGSVASLAELVSVVTRKDRR